MREDGIWLTDAERRQMLRQTNFALDIHGVKRKLFEALLPSAEPIADTITEETYKHGRLGSYVHADPNLDPADVGTDLAFMELISAGIDPDDLPRDPVHDDQPATVEGRFRVPLQMSFNIALVSSTDYEMEYCDQARPDVLAAAREKVAQALSIMPPRIRSDFMDSELAEYWNLGIIPE